MVTLRVTFLTFIIIIHSVIVSHLQIRITITLMTVDKLMGLVDKLMGLVDTELIAMSMEGMDNTLHSVKREKITSILELDKIIQVVDLAIFRHIVKMGRAFIIAMVLENILVLMEVFLKVEWKNQIVFSYSNASLCFQNKSDFIKIIK